jgi:hypothetical protein
MSHRIVIHPKRLAKNLGKRLVIETSVPRSGTISAGPQNAHSSRITKLRLRERFAEFSTATRNLSVSEIEVNNAESNDEIRRRDRD